MSDKTYVYEAKEYVLTGRTAKKTMRSGNEKLLYEIRPADTDATQTQFNKWVTMDDLYVIEDK